MRNQKNKEKSKNTFSILWPLFNIFLTPEYEYLDPKKEFASTRISGSPFFDVLSHPSFSEIPGGSCIPFEPWGPWGSMGSCYKKMGAIHTEYIRRIGKIEILKRYKNDYKLVKRNLDFWEIFWLAPNILKYWICSIFHFFDLGNIAHVQYQAILWFQSVQYCNILKTPRFCNI